MTQVFYVASAFAVVAAFLAVTRSNALHAVLYLVLSLFALAIDFLALGAPFIAALEIIVYAGAIVVVILFVMMMVAGAAGAARKQELSWMPPRAWVIPSLLAAALAVLTIGALAIGDEQAIEITSVGPQQVGAALFTTYLIGVELASVLLLAGLIGAYYLGNDD